MGKLTFHVNLVNFVLNKNNLHVTQRVSLPHLYMNLFQYIGLLYNVRLTLLENLTDNAIILSSM